MAKYYYKSGIYPTTMQAMYTEFNKELYNGIFNNFRNKYNVKKDFNLEFNPNFKYCLNKTAYIVFDDNKKIVDFAFEEFIDFVWILQVNNNDKVEFNLPCSVTKRIKEDLELFSDRIKKIL